MPWKALAKACAGNARTLQAAGGHRGEADNPVVHQGHVRHGQVEL